MKLMIGDLVKCTYNEYDEFDKYVGDFLAIILDKLTDNTYQVFIVSEKEKHNIPHKSGLPCTSGTLLPAGSITYIYVNNNLKKIN